MKGAIMKKRIIMFMAIATTLFSCSKQVSEMDSPGSRTLKSAIINLVKNPSFYFGANGIPSYWHTDAWSSSGTTFTWQKYGGMDNSECISISSTTANDAVYSQSVPVIPGELYELSGYIKGDNIVSEGSVGANIGIKGTWIRTRDEGSTNSFGWVKKTICFFASTESVEVVCRLGHHGNLATGTAYFDNISLTLAPKYTLQTGKYVALYLESDDLAGITSENLTNWIRHLDTAYNDYAELVGGRPYKGDPIVIQSVRDYPGGWAVAGNPILWHQPYVASSMVKINNDGDWSFGILHELGHDFDLDYKWVWNAEFWANLKMYYVVNKRNAKVSPGYSGIYYTGGQQLKGYYYNQGSPANLTWDYMTGRFIDIFDSIGWNAVKLTFQFYKYSAPEAIPSTNIGKLHFFLSSLTSIAQQNVWKMFTQEELDWMDAQVSK